MKTDLALRLWRDGYAALPRLRGDRGDVFETTLLGRRAVVVRGRSGAEHFYDSSLVARRGAVPPAIADLLFGRDAVHGLDGEAHSERKELFLDLLSPERTAALADAAGRQVAERAAAWRGNVTVFDELVESYGAAVLPWAGVYLPPAQTKTVAHRLAAIVDGFGGAPGAYPRGWTARLWADRWASRELGRARARQEAGSDTVAGRLATAGLPPKVAAVELLNILRPTVAVAWHGTFVALELTRHPEGRARIAAGDEAYARAFVHEVRRLSPFVPALAGRARRAATLEGVEVHPGDLLVLDVDGTGHDPSGWEAPEAFRPERFEGSEPDPFGFVPQGGGDPRQGHRCPGEPLAVRMLVATARALASVDYDVVSAPSYDERRMPTLPRRGLMVHPARS